MVLRVVVRGFVGIFRLICCVVGIVLVVVVCIEKLF